MSKIIKWLMKPKYLYIFLERYQQTLYVKSRLMLKKFKNKISLKNSKKTFVVALDKPAYISNNIRVFFIDYETNDQYTFIQIESLMNPEELDTILNNHLIRELARGVMDNVKQKIMYLIIGAIMGVLLGFLIADMIKQQKIDELYEQLRNSQPIIFDMVRMLF